MNENYYRDRSTKYGIGSTRRRKIFQLIGTVKNRKILDVGCATGYVGSELKEMGNYVVGIDVSEPAAQQAKEKLNEAYAADISGNWPDEVKNKKFDLVILAEVLEHVFDPVNVLEKVNSVLENDGEVIITTPNIMAWHNRLRFLFGKFKYENQGTFDFGHIRFFTYAYLKEVLRVSGFKVDVENHIIYPGKLTRILKFWPSIFANQFIVKAKKNR